MIDNKRPLSLVGPATRAREVVSDEFSTGKSVKSRRSHLVIVSEEASDNAKKKLINMYTYYKAPIYLFRTKDELGHAMGQEFRVSLLTEGAGLTRSMVGRINISGGSLNESR